MVNQHTPQDPIGGLYRRLIEHTDEPCNDQACWLWNGQMTSRYPKMNLRVGGVHMSIKPHRAILVLLECEGELEHFLSLYKAYSIAEFDADHFCRLDTRCINPDHLQWLTKEEHKAKTNEERLCNKF